ncbi:putative GTP-binding protein EngB [Philodulcilactobacillus myokoensis]|uniref:Probable GTP-binding protein EngB n=1 Tax=Philodulcilactobacillus myokoensis TaxID=2929573 RepID=A0A9W6B1Z3_9LACO|nr:ribosome biogenesis GTP-binding protein YihA/YsxC [Philodulcilactobacillus myokoensis]GLB46980.1 putative GTP-binding protein EngB [Philodulcilactobacillus myokoensis]
MAVNINNVNLEISAVEPKQYPRSNHPEIALVGRSNVGKSSLTNVLVNRKNYAHTSNQPGKTQTLNFYNVENKIYFVDIPGYGFARVSKMEREKWATMIETYLTQRNQLDGAINLIDGRHKPTQTDIQMKAFLEYYQIPTLIVATKMDKIKKSHWNKSKSLIKKTMGLNDDQLVLFSAKTRSGKDQIWNWIQQQSGVVMD